MKEITLNRLRLGKQYVGYRVNVTEGSNRIVAFDVSDDNVKAFLKMFRTNDIKKGVVIDGKMVGNLFVTPDETNVHEVTDKASAEALLEKYYFSEPKGLSDMVDITETAEEVSDRERRELIVSLESEMCCRFPSLEDGCFEGFSNWGNIPKVYGCLTKALKGLKFNVCVWPHVEDGQITVCCDFMNFKDYLSFEHNLHKMLGKKTMVFNTTCYENGVLRSNVKDTGVEVCDSKNAFISSVLRMLGISNQAVILADEVCVGGYCGSCDSMLSEEGLYRAHYFLSVPKDEYDEQDPNSEKYKEWFFTA